MSKLFVDIRARATDKPVTDGVVAKGFAFPEDVLHLLEAIDVMSERLTELRTDYLGVSAKACRDIDATLNTVRVLSEGGEK